MGRIKASRVLVGREGLDRARHWASIIGGLFAWSGENLVLTWAEYRRVEEAHRPLVRAAVKHTGKGKKSEKESVARTEGAVKRKREETDEGEEVKEFQTFKSSAPRRLHDVALAPPTLTSAPRGAGTTVGKTVPMARRVMLERERERAIEMYRAGKRRGP
ncbi:hypothetical protein FS749_002701 [Ceratobasidium sp. UAMH 11750]|nr:hypothetical protein FS749_002701 [Ceratobasidium sp. UAMH 11750]